jgi:hypothetical protein
MLRNAYKDNLDGTTWLGEVVDIADPLKIGRIKVKVFGKFDQIPTEDIPWAYPGNNSTGSSATGGGFFSVPKLKSMVSVKFDNGNLYHPEYFFTQKISDEVKAEIENSYDNAHIIIYDTVTEGKLKIFFTEEKGLMIDYKETQINIKPDKTVNITTTDAVNVKCKDLIIEHSNTIELGKGAKEKVVLGDTFMKLFNQHQHIGNLGAPTSPPVAPMTPTHLSQKKVVTL